MRGDMDFLEMNSKEFRLGFGRALGSEFFGGNDQLLYD